MCLLCIVHVYLYIIGASMNYWHIDHPTDTWRNNYAMITSSLRRRRRRLDAMKTLLLRCVPTGHIQRTVFCYFVRMILYVDDFASVSVSQLYVSRIVLNWCRYSVMFFTESKLTYADYFIPDFMVTIGIECCQRNRFMRLMRMMIKQFVWRLFCFVKACLHNDINFTHCIIISCQ